MMSVLLLSLAAAVLVAGVPMADATFTNRDPNISCDPQGMIHMSWSPASGHDTYYIYISPATSNQSIYTDEVTNGKTSHLVPAEGVFGDIYRGNLFKFTVAIKADHRSTDWLDVIRATFACPNLPPTVSAGTDQTVGVNTVAYLSGSGSDPYQDKLTYTWTCSYADGTRTIPVTQHNTVHAEFMVPNVPNGTQITCTITARDGHNAVSDSVIVTAESSWDGTPSDQDTQTTPPSQVTPPEQPSQLSGPASTGRAFAILPSSNLAESSEPSIVNGTLRFVHMTSVPVNMTHWNGTSTMPFQCDIQNNGYLVIHGVEYRGMEPFDIRTSHTTHATLSDRTTYNITIHTISTYNMTAVGPFGAVLGVDTGIDFIWKVFPQILDAFRQIWDTVTITQVSQFGSVLYETQGGSCWVP